MVTAHRRASLFDHNRQRVKTPGQLVNEFQLQKEIEEQRAKLREQSTQIEDGKPPGQENFPDPDKGQSRDKAAESIGADVSGKTLEKGERVKTPGQLVNEFQLQKEIEERRAQERNRQTAGEDPSREKLPDTDTGRSRDKAAESIGADVSGKTLEKGERVKEQAEAGDEIRRFDNRRTRIRQSSPIVLSQAPVTPSSEA